MGNPAGWNWDQQTRKAMDEARARQGTKPHNGSSEHARSRRMFLKSEVDYRHPSPHANERCALCVMFRRPHACTTVAGFIRREDYCDKFQGAKANG